MLINLLSFITAKKQSSKSEGRKTGGGARYKAPNQVAAKIIESTMVETPLMKGVPGGRASGLGGRF